MILQTTLTNKAGKTALVNFHVRNRNISARFITFPGDKDTVSITVQFEI